MKKILLLLMSLLIIGCAYRGIIQADSTNSMNLLDPTLFTSVEFEESYNGTDAKLETSASGFIPIISGIEYFLMPTYVNKETIVGTVTWVELPQFALMPTIELYDDEQELIGSINDLKILESYTVLCGYAFQVNTGVAYIKLSSLLLTSSLISPVDFANYYENVCEEIDGALLLMEADKIKYLSTNTGFDYEAVRGAASYDISSLYLGEDLQVYRYGNPYWDDLSPIIGSNTYEYTTTVDEPISLIDLRRALQITAYDEIDGNITESILISAPLYQSKVLDVATVNERELGTYVISFSVFDAAGNEASMTISLTVLDTSRPVVHLDQSTIAYTREVDDLALTIEDITSHIMVTDNYSEISIADKVDNYTGHEQEKGVFTIVLTYEDTSHNEINVTVTITNEDHTAPTITSSLSSQNISYTYYGNIVSILNDFNISVVDNYDGSLDYLIVSDDYTPNSRYVGQYEVTIQAIDSSGNIQVATYEIHVIDDVSPQFYIDNNVVVVNTGQLFSEQDLMTLLKTRRLTKPMAFSIEIISDEYTPNCHQVGEYEMMIQVQYENGDIEQQQLVFKVETLTEPIPTGFFATLWFQIKKIFRWVWNVFKWPFEKLNSLF